MIRRAFSLHAKNRRLLYLHRRGIWAQRILHVRLVHDFRQLPCRYSHDGHGLCQQFFGPVPSPQPVGCRFAHDIHCFNPDSVNGQCIRSAFGGYYTLSYMSGEIKNPKSNLPLATIIGMAGSATPVSDAAKVAFGSVGATLITLGATVSIFGSTNGTLLSMPRVAYAMAENHMMFPFFAKLHPKYKTPYITLMIYAVVAVVFVWTGNFMTLLMMSTFVSCLSGVAVCILPDCTPQEAARPGVTV